MLKCRNCNEVRPLLCKSCVTASLPVSTRPLRRDIERVKLRIKSVSESISDLERQVSVKSSTIKGKNEKHSSNKAVVEAQIRRLNLKSSIVPLSEYLANPDQWENQLTMLHPFRKLRSAAFSLQEERRAKCQLLFSFFPETADLDLPEEELTREVTFTFATQILVLWSNVLDAALPFPIALGSQSSSELLLSEEAGHLPRILHSGNRKLVYLDPRGGNRSNVSLANKLFAEDLESMASMWGATRGGGDLLEFFSRLLQSPLFGNPLILPRIKIQPITDFRDERIQTEGDGGDWTLLNLNQ